MIWCCCQQLPYSWQYTRPFDTLTHALWVTGIAWLHAVDHRLTDHRGFPLMFLQIRNRLRVFVAQHRSRQCPQPRLGSAYGNEIFSLSASVLAGNAKWVLAKFNQMVMYQVHQVQPGHVKVNKFEFRLSSEGWGLACPTRYHLPQSTGTQFQVGPNAVLVKEKPFEMTVFSCYYNSAEHANRNDRRRIPPSSPECRNLTYELTLALKWSLIHLK